MSGFFKKIILFGFIFLIGGFIFYFSYKFSKKADCPRKEGVIIAFGDSLVEGYGVKENENFVSILSKKVEEPILNKGRSGEPPKLHLIDSKKMF